jgi:hypothetical protein
VIAGESPTKRLSPSELEIVNVGGRVELYEEELVGWSLQLGPILTMIPLITKILLLRRKVHISLLVLAVRK